MREVGTHARYGNVFHQSSQSQNYASKVFHQHSLLSDGCDSKHQLTFAKAVVPKLVEAVTQINVAIMSYGPQ